MQYANVRTVHRDPRPRQLNRFVNAQTNLTRFTTFQTVFVQNIKINPFSDCGRRLNDFTVIRL